LEKKYNKLTKGGKLLDFLKSFSHDTLFALGEEA
jgi:hypothetical protein